MVLFKSILLIVLVLYSLGIFEATVAQSFCPECICPVEYSPICAKQLKTNKLRGFSSRCVMECSNQCRKDKFQYLKNGRCRIKKPVLEPNAGPTKPTKRPSLLFL